MCIYFLQDVPKLQYKVDKHTVHDLEKTQNQLIAYCLKKKTQTFTGLEAEYYNTLNENLKDVAC